jgi:erythromycin 3''-O-methyltransferase
MQIPSEQERTAWTKANLRHAASVFHYGRNPAARVYESIGSDFFLALAPGWLNLGLWEGDGGDRDEAPVAVRRLVERLCAGLPVGGDILDVGNGLGAQDLVIARALCPKRLVAANITTAQLHAGRERLRRARAHAVAADAVALPFRSSSFDGVISVEAAFHFASRARFFAEALRLLRPGGVLAMSDVPTIRRPRTPRELAASLAMMRVWGLPLRAAASPSEIVEAASAAGFVEVRTELVGDRVIGPALRFARGRLVESRGVVPRTFWLAARTLLSQAELLWNRRMIDYVLLSARLPPASSSAGVERSQPSSRRSAGSGSDPSPRSRS